MTRLLQEPCKRAHAGAADADQVDVHEAFRGRFDDPRGSRDQHVGWKIPSASVDSELSGPILEFTMSAAPKPLSERIRDVVSDLLGGALDGALDDLLETLGGLMNPPPVPVPIPIRGGRRGRSR